MISEQARALPYNASMGDLQRVLDFLRSKPTGATSVQAKRVLEPKLFDPRKTGFYLWSGFIGFADNKWRLTSLGNRYVHGDAGEKQRMLWTVIREYGPYHDILDWAWRERKDTVTADELRLKWVTDFSDVVSNENKQRVQGAPVTMFSVCESAGLGEFKLGRRGAASRFEIDRQALERYDGAGYSQASCTDLKSETKIATQADDAPTSITAYLGRRGRRDNPEFAFPLSNHQVISVVLPDEIPSEDEEDIKLWLQLLLRRRMKHHSGGTGS